MDDIGSIAPALDEDDFQTNLPYLASYQQGVNSSFQHPYLVQENPDCQYPNSLLAEREGGWPDVGSTWDLLQNDGTGKDVETFGDQTTNHLGLVQLPGSCNDCFQRGNICEWHQSVFLHSLDPHSCSRKDDQRRMLINIPTVRQRSPN